MSSMINDSESVKRFRDDLLETVDKLRNQLRQTEQAMEEVSQEWKDHQFHKYNEEFGKDKERIEPLCKRIEEYEDEILRPIYEILYKYENL